MTIYNNETYRIDDVEETADQFSEFLKKDGSKMTYCQYYKEVNKTFYILVNYLCSIIMCILCRNGI